MNNNNGGRERVQDQKALQYPASDNVNFLKLAADLAKTGRNFYSRGWVLGTSGNFSAVTSAKPLRLVISSTGLDKGSLTPSQFLEIDDNSNVARGEGCPSAEALLHIMIVCSLYECSSSFTYALCLEYSAFQCMCFQRWCST